MDDATGQLTAAMARGEAWAVEAFYRRFFGLLLSHAHAVTGRDESFCLDVVHEAVLKIVRTVRPVASEAQFVAWMKLVVKSVAYDLLRQEQSRTRREADRQPPGPPSEDLEERLTWLSAQLEQIDPQLRRLIDLRYNGRLTLTRIGQAVGLPTATVHRRLALALGQLRREAQEVFGD